MFANRVHVGAVVVQKLDCPAEVGPVGATGNETPRALYVFLADSFSEVEYVSP
jgi:hypothetical protein